MLLVVLLAILALALFGVGFVVHALWWVAIIAVVVLVISLVVRGTGRGSSF